MDMRKLLEAVTKFAGEPKQKPGDQVRGTEKANPTKSGGDHPFKGRLVGGESKDPTLLQDLSKLSEEMSTEWKLAEMWANFNEDDLGVEPKRPSRKSDRPRREYTKPGQPSKRYTPVKEDAYDDGFTGKEPKKDTPDYKTAYEAGKRDAWVANAARKTEKADESRGHKVLATKLGNMERMKNVQIPTPAERKQQELDRIAREKGNQDKEQVKEYGATPPVKPGQQPGIPTITPSAEDAKKAMAASTQLKAATSSTATPDKLLTAIDKATQGTAIDATSAKILQPMMGVVAKAATDPKLATQFKTLANQARQVK